MASMLELVMEAEGSDYGKRLYIYEMGGTENPTRFYEGAGPYGNDSFGIGYMQIEGSPRHNVAFIVAPTGYDGDRLFAWIKENQ